MRDNGAVGDQKTLFDKFDADQKELNEKLDKKLNDTLSQDIITIYKTEQLKEDLSTIDLFKLIDVNKSIEVDDSLYNNLLAFIQSIQAKQPKQPGDFSSFTKEMLNEKLKVQLDPGLNYTKIKKCKDLLRTPFRLLTKEEITTLQSWYQNNNSIIQKGIYINTYLKSQIALQYQIVNAYSLFIKLQPIIGCECFMYNTDSSRTYQYSIFYHYFNYLRMFLTELSKNYELKEPQQQPQQQPQEPSQQDLEIMEDYGYNNLQLNQMYKLFQSFSIQTNNNVTNIKYTDFTDPEEITTTIINLTVMYKNNVSIIPSDDAAAAGDDTTAPSDAAADAAAD